MNLNNVDELANSLDNKSRSSILKLIDLKTENDMKEVISKMDNMLAKIDARFSHIDARFERMDARFERIDAKFEHIDEKFAHVEATIETKMTTIYWVIGVASAVLTLVLSLVSLYAGK